MRRCWMLGWVGSMISMLEWAHRVYASILDDRP